jgi:peroxiredoxin/mono/diheme cytochrome c family protein
MRSLQILVPMLALCACPVPAQGSPRAIDEFELRDFQGKVRKLSDWRASKLVVVVFLGTGCPLAELYGSPLTELAREFEQSGVTFIGIDANQHDTAGEIAQYVKAHRIPFAILQDLDCMVADQFGATRTPEVFVLDERRLVRYQGRVDDQYGLGRRRAQPTRRDLALALRELLAGRPVSTPTTEAVGCSIDRPGRTEAQARTSYYRDVAPVLQKHCVACHRAGQIAPFPLTKYAEVQRRAATIERVVRAGRMPPWHANPAHGKFANDPSLTADEKRVIAQWVEDDCPAGNPADQPTAVNFPEEWSIPKPDLVLPIPSPFSVPAEGTIEYQYFEVDPGFREDRWIQAAEIRPGNRAVVHHCSVFLKPPGATEVAEQGALGSFCLAAMAVGTPPMILPPGMAKLIPAGWRLVFVVHYTPVGTAQTDQTSIGLVFADPKTVRKEVATRILLDTELCIPPGVADHRVEHAWLMPADMLLFAMFPHMHLRGKSFRYEAVYPDGQTEILLDVPRYDFNWQHRYVLAEPKRLPAGTTLRCVAIYDNSANNPANPDPGATVRTGPQSWDEMFNGYFDVALADQDLARPPTWREMIGTTLRNSARLAIMVAFSVLGGGFLLFLRSRRPSVDRPA